MKSILVATTNAGKLQEFRFLFKDLNVEILSLLDFPAVEIPKETGETFEENAMIKANFYFTAFNIPVIVEDSGFCIKELQNLPGVHSADWGMNGDFSEGIARIYEMLNGRNSEAFFVSVAVFKSVEKCEISRGEVSGFIAEKPRGTNGFGFDPCFIPNSCEKTFGEMTLEEKSRFSHRKIAIQNLLTKL
jgi:XTP/dITP diphosphohydrolase